MTRECFKSKIARWPFAGSATGSLWVTTLMLLLTLGLSACSFTNNKNSASSDLNTPFNIVSKSSFNTTVRPLLLAHCASCHGGSTHPLHAASDLDLAYSEVVSYSLVDLDNVSASRFYSRLANDHHNCWNGDCGASAQSMLDALKAWKAANDIAPLPDDPSRLVGPPQPIPASVATAPADLSLTLAATELRFTILNHAKGPVILSLRVEKLDASNDRVFWPTIIAPVGVKITLRDIGFKINGKLLNQSAFSYLYREVSGQGAATPVLLDSLITMTIVTQNGPGADTIAPSFGMFIAP